MMQMPRDKVMRKMSALVVDASTDGANHREALYGHRVCLALC
jgi:hypothetical protein